MIEPPEIRDRNWIPFASDDDFEPGVGRLLTALSIDPNRIDGIVLSLSD